MPKPTLTTTQLSHIFRAYEPNDLVKTARIAEAYANDVYDITDSAGRRFVMRILKIQKSENVALEAEMQKRLARASIGTPQYIELRKGVYVGEHEGARFTLSKYIEGKAPKTASLELIQDFGAVLSKLHDCLKGITVPPSDMQWFDLEHAKKGLAQYNGPLKKDLQVLLNTGLNIFDQDLPTAVTHGDLWLGNVFAEKDKITAVFDLETVQDTLRIIDLGRTYTSMRIITNHLADSIRERLFAGHDSVAEESLTKAEQNNFPLVISYVAAVCATWHALHGTRYAGPYIDIGKEALAHGR